MKKLLGILVLSLILIESAYADPSKKIRSYSKDNDGFNKFARDARFFCAKESGKANNDFSAKKIYSVCISKMNYELTKIWPDGEIF